MVEGMKMMLGWHRDAFSAEPLRQRHADHCAESAGPKLQHRLFIASAAFELHDLATAFAKQRVQFGRPIGQLQTIQGYLAQLIMEILGSDTLTMFTAFHMDRGRHVRGYVGKTKGFASETVYRTMDIGSQIFGGMGYMEEVDSTLYLRRGKQYELMLGGSGYWYDVVAEEMIDVEDPEMLI
jgi:alkylation response protein AidB-like acyl-CoA dehydrogenase